MTGANGEISGVTEEMTDNSAPELVESQHGFVGSKSQLVNALYACGDHNGRTASVVCKTAADLIRADLCAADRGVTMGDTSLRARLSEMIGERDIIDADEVREILAALQPTEAQRATPPTDTALVEAANKVCAAIDQSITDNGTDIKTVTLLDGSKHTGPVCDLFHEIMDVTRRTLRAALARREAPPAPKPSVQEPDGWLFMHNSGGYEAFRAENEAIQEADKYDRSMTVKPFYFEPPPRVIAENQLAAVKRTMIREAFTTGMDAALRALGGSN